MPLEVQSGIVRENRPGLAGYHTHLSGYLGNTEHRHFVAIFYLIFGFKKISISINIYSTFLNLTLRVLGVIATGVGLKVMSPHLG